MEFKPITYFVVYDDKPHEVSGFAFETPGWPEFHACIRRGNRFTVNVFDDDGWIVDHYESGAAISPIGVFDNMQDAPAALAAHLDSKGREVVHARLQELSAL